jgi:hypothetical protein
MSTTSVITKELVAFAREHFALAWQGIHGAPHWARVLRNGMLVGREYDADLTVIQHVRMMALTPFMDRVVLNSPFSFTTKN